MKKRTHADFNAGTVTKRVKQGYTSEMSTTDELRKRVLKHIEHRARHSGAKDNSIHERPLLSTPLPLSTSARPSLPVNDQLEILDALNVIKTTPFENSFLSRLQGTRPGAIHGMAPNHALYVDWETVTPWMKLMTDIRDHFALAHADSEEGFDAPPTETIAPIAYTTLQPSHLIQVHDLLGSAFWSGIDVSDSLDYSPKQATVIAVYKKLVVGVAILSSPQETYITFLAVRAGWDKAQVAKTMLYLLISRNPGKDITLHVSVNNSAMLLYNQFGFKAEEFVAGFYHDYLDPLSRASANAFKLRLRY